MSDVNLADIALLASLNISNWSARRFDPIVTEEVNESKNADAHAGRWNKKLFPKDDSDYGDKLGKCPADKITAIATQARIKHDYLTRQWKKGSSILPTALLDQYTEVMNGLAEQYKTAVEEWIEVFPLWVEVSKQFLSGMFSDNDYPTAKDIRRRYSFSYHFDPVPTKDDFRCKLTKGQAEQMQADLEVRVQKAVEDAMRDTAQKIIDVVGNMEEQLTQYSKKEGSKLHKSLVGNVRQLAAVLDGFNITNDRKLTLIIKRIQRELCVEDIKELKENGDARKSVAQAAKEIVAQVEEYLA